MKILLYGLNFAPEPTGIGKYSGEKAFWLADAGHDVRVVTGFPYYPSWEIGHGYNGSWYSKEVWKNVQIIRVPLWVPKNPTGISRIFHLLSFAVMSIPALLQQLRWRPQVICVVAPAFACAPAGWLSARLCGSAAWLHVQDFEVDAAFRMGLLRSKAVQWLASTMERWMFQRFDRVSTISGRMVELLAVKGVKPDRAVWFPNWVDLSLFPKDAGSGEYRAQLDIPKDAVIALYSGSMAGKQGLELLPIVARMLERIEPNLLFIICGDGVCKPAIERACEGLSNTRFLPLQPSERVGELLATADIHLLPQHPAAADLVMPSKLTGMLASGRPVIVTAYPGTELASVVASHGRVVQPDDAEAFASALRELVASAPLRRNLGESGRHYAETNLAKDRVLGNFEDHLQTCISELRSLRSRDAGTTSSAGEVPAKPL